MFAETVYFLRKNSINLSTFAGKTKAVGFFHKKFTKFTKFTHFRVRVWRCAQFQSLRRSRAWGVPDALRALQSLRRSICASRVPVVGGGG